MSIKLKTFIILHDKKFLNKIKKMLHMQHLYLIGSLSGFPWPLGNFFGVFFTFLIIIIFLSNSFPTFNLSILSNLPPKTTRAVSNFSTILEYMLPFIKVGGYAICMKGPNYAEKFDTALVVAISYVSLYSCFDAKSSALECNISISPKSISFVISLITFNFLFTESISVTFLS